jgi:hypothetical protein
MRRLITAAAAALLTLACVPAMAYPRGLWMIPVFPQTFLGVLGAIILTLLGVGVNYPYSLAVLGIMSLVALSDRGRARWRVWMGVGIVYEIPSLLLYRSSGYYHFGPYGQEARVYEITGGITLCVILAIGVCILYEKVIRPRIM